MVWVCAAGGSGVDVAAGGLVCVGAGGAMDVGKGVGRGVGSGVAKNRFATGSPNNADAADALARTAARMSLCHPIRMCACRVL